jgi:hypothetical protein
MADNLKSWKGVWWELLMIKGKREVLIGRFPYKQRAESIAASLDWGGFSPKIQKVNE